MAVDYELPIYNISNDDMKLLGLLKTSPRFLDALMNICVITKFNKIVFG